MVMWNLLGKAATPRLLLQSTRGRWLTTLPPLSVSLYQYAICPYCNKVKSVLHYAKIPHTVVEVNPLTKAELPDKDYRKVPLARIDDEVVKGSDEIMQALLHRTELDPNAGQEWVDFANDELAHLLYPNICASLGDAYQAFGYVDRVDSFSYFQKMAIQSAGSVAMYLAASRVKSE